ncbi:phage integrase N-terminal SAM-like domain-containing protein [Clostridium magnum]|uniref:Tyrosine recombinase XerC n=1 Tax=Clostridium magnum DSM 2767 TaxID=1121326 RepID=A0A161YK96_9CLOT|nr:phage integrase N-terminal SAM-like domain-containing protein [Clostridium magnum]KZL90932.1 tyrosine recombinase XerC [Clostridium magnum DSM 2767]SHJ38291.1 Phage integrase, N-terminal SAM-like domain [Clostridium magnum DSM 2767]
MIEEFKKYLLYKEHKSSSTIKTYSRCIEQFIDWYHSSKNKDIFKLDRETINGYKEYLMLVEKMNAQTISVRLCALAMFNKFFYNKNAPKNYILRKKYESIN